MALTILQRPQGHKLTYPTPESVSVTNNGGFAYFSYPGYGMDTGDFVFIDGNLGAYNGYWYIQDVGDDDHFYIRPYATAANVSYINSGTVQVSRSESTDTHNWSAVHLPIIFKLSSNLWPTNSADTVRTVSSISNDAGYVNLNLSGDIKATGTAAELEFVQVFGQNAGIYQIINWISDSDITIDMPYSAGVSFSASTVQYYYKDYHARIKVYAGLNSTHTWGAQKPYEEIVTINVVPDPDGIMTINIADFVKGKINVDTNNTALDTLPNDIDSFCQFYIETAEAYTYSNGYTLGTNVTSFTSDQGNFEGYAINAMLPFKTQSSGFMDDYVSSVNPAQSVAQKFLTNFEEPEIFDGQYFDLSFIINSNSSGFYILEQYLNSGVIVSTVQTSLTDYDAGVYRFQVSYNSAYEKVRVSLYSVTNQLLSEVKEIKINADCSNFYTDLTWKNYLGGHDHWRFNAGKQKSLNTKKTETATNYFTNWPKSYGKFGETIRKNASVMGNKSFLIRSQYVTNQQAEDLAGIQYALLVQEVTSETNKRTVLVDDGGFTIVEETDKLVEVMVKIKYTDDLPVQSL